MLTRGKFTVMLMKHKLSHPQSWGRRSLTICSHDHMLLQIAKLRYLCILSLKNGIPNCTSSRVYAINNLPWCCLAYTYRLSWVWQVSTWKSTPKPLSKQPLCRDLVTQIIRPCHNDDAAISKDLNHKIFFQRGIKKEFNKLNSQSSMSHH